MAHVVGPKGQVVIEKEIRERLGVQPGWLALQVPGDNHVKIYFIPPEHNRSLRGAAKPFIRREPAPDEDWDDAIADAIAEEYRQSLEEE
jgi:bifunctional DNA-binding transcriptional regulator/antitoxin component of YhaV-PrlF toxin-antitoxin module